MIECRKCRLGFDRSRHEAGTATERVPGGRPAPDAPPGFLIEEVGETLVMVLPRTLFTGIALLVVALCTVATSIAFGLMSNLPGVVFFAALALLLGSWGVGWTFTRARFTVTPTELRLDRVPFGGTRAVIPVRDLQQIAIARTRRGRKQLRYDIELLAQLPDHDVSLLTVSSLEIAQYLEERIERHVGIVDDAVEMVVPGAQ